MENQDFNVEASEKGTVNNEVAETLVETGNKELEEFFETFKLNEAKNIYCCIADKGRLVPFMEGVFTEGAKLKDAVKQYIGKYNVQVVLNPYQNASYINSEVNTLLDCSESGPMYMKMGLVKQLEWFVIDVIPKPEHGRNVLTDGQYLDIEKYVKGLASILTKEYDFPEPIILASGYGVQLVYKACLPADKFSENLIKNFLRYIKTIHLLPEAYVIFNIYNPLSSIRLYPISISGSKISDDDNSFTVKLLQKPSVIQTLDIHTLENLYSKMGRKLRRDKLEELLGGVRNNKNFDLNAWFEAVVLINRPYINGSNGMPYIDIDCTDSGRVYSYEICTNGEFIKDLTWRIVDEEGIPLGNRDNVKLKQYVTRLLLRAKKDNNVEAVHKRIAYKDGTVYYDLNDEDGNVFVIDKDGFKPLEKCCSKCKNLHLLTSNAMLPQVYPSNDYGLPLYDLLDPFLNVDEETKKLLIVILVSYFIDCNHAFLWINGQQGTGKTRLIKLIQKIVDPSVADPSSIPTSTKDLAIDLSTRYVVSYDNLYNIKQEASDLLCRATSGGSISTRRLYTTKDNECIAFRNVVVIGGISSGMVENPDLLERMVKIRTLPFNGKRELESELDRQLNEYLPTILFRIFETISKAIKIYPDIQPNNQFRLMDMTKWSCAISKALFDDENLFVRAYANSAKQNDIAIIENDVIANAVLDYILEGVKLGDKYPKSYQSKEYYSIIAKFCQETEAIKNSCIPGDATALSKRLEKFDTNFKNIGITFDRNQRNNKGRLITVDVDKNVLFKSIEV